MSHIIEDFIHFVLTSPHHPNGSGLGNRYNNDGKPLPQYHDPKCTKADGTCNCKDPNESSVTVNKSLDELINQAAFELPDTWEINIEIQQGYAEVIITKPDGSLIHMFEDDINLNQQFQNALTLIRKEINT
jgi:hypothetical protein